jgi:hypothetical protein
LPERTTDTLVVCVAIFNGDSHHNINNLGQTKTMIHVQITTPVLPGKRAKAKFEKLIKEVVLKATKDDVCNISFYQDGKDIYGLTNFGMLVMDSGRNELDDLRNEIYTQILTMLIAK